MNSREAFEAKWPMPKNCIWTGKGYAATEYNAWDAADHAKRWEGWQAAIAHARDVAVKACDRTSYEAPRHEREYYYNDACNDCADAIKEALK